MLAAGLVSRAANATFMVELDGTVLDTVTGLEWEQNTNHGPFNWAGSGGGSTTTGYANTLALDGSGWRLATIDELQTLYKHLSTDTGCADCTGDKGPFAGIQDIYWSSSEVVAGDARLFFFFNGHPDDDFEFNQNSA